MNWMPPSTWVREALEKALASETEPSTAAELWLSRWRGSLPKPPEATDDSARLTHLLNKHLR